MSNVRPESMARITNFELANAFIDEQVKLVREQVGDKKGVSKVTLERGTYTVKVEGENSYAGRTAQATLIIKPVGLNVTFGEEELIYNGQAQAPTLTVKENFTVFNFQSLLANKNGVIANAQMLLVLKWLDNEIIKNREFNIKYGTKRKIVVAIDEAHVFIDPKFPVALDFMYQLAKRIRKYNGMQIVITQNIKDFVGTQDIIRKSTAIINACQYSMILQLAPNDMSDLLELYKSAGGINKNEQDGIVTAPLGRAFMIVGPMDRSFIDIHALPNCVEIMGEGGYVRKK